MSRALMARQKSKNKFSVKKRKVVFSKGPIHLVDCLVKMPSGKTLSRQIIEHPGAVVIIPRISTHQYLLIKQFRYAAQDWIWEFPAGGIDKGESLRQAAKRELVEEVSFGAKKLKQLISFYPTPGISSEVMHLFLASDLYPAFAKGDEDEELEVHSFSLKQIGTMIQEGDIVDGKTILSYYCLKNCS